MKQEHIKLILNTVRTAQYKAGHINLCYFVEEGSVHIYIYICVYSFGLRWGEQRRESDAICER